MVLSLKQMNTFEGLKQGRQRQLFSYRIGLYGARQDFIGARQAIYSQWHHQGGDRGGQCHPDTIAGPLLCPAKAKDRNSPMC